MKIKLNRTTEYFGFYPGPLILRPISIFLITQSLFVLYPLASFISDYPDDPLYVKSLAVASTGVASTLLSYIIFKSTSSRNQTVQSYHYETKTRLLYNLFFIYFLVAPILLFAHVAIAGTIPLLESIKGADHLQLAYAREIYDKNLNPLMQVAVTLSERVLPMFLLILLLANYHIENGLKSRKLAIITLIFFVIVSSFALAKTPPVVALLLYLIVNMLAKKKGLNYYLTTLFALLFGIGIMGVLAGGSDISLADMPALIQDLVFRRIFTLTADVFSNYIAIFPTLEGHLYGKGIRFVSMLTGDFNFQLSNLVYNYMFPDGIGSGWANTAYQGELWADFGYPGVIIGSIFLGYILSQITITCCDKRYVYRGYGLLLQTFSFLLISFLAVSSMFSSIIIIMLLFIYLIKPIFFKKVTN